MSNIPYYVPTYVFPGESRALRVSSLKVSKDDKGGVWPVEFYDKGGVWTVEFYEKPTPDPRIIRGGVQTKGCNIAENCRGDYLVDEESKAYMVPRATFEAIFVKKHPYQFGSKQYLEEKLNELKRQLEDVQANRAKPEEQTPCTRESFDFDMVRAGLSRAVLALENLIQTAQLDPSLDEVRSVALQDILKMPEAKVVRQNAGT